MDTYKKMFMDHLIIVFLCLFVIMYVFMNYQQIKNGIFPVALTKPFLISAIAIVLCYLLFTLNESDETANLLNGNPNQYKVVTVANPDVEIAQLPQNKIFMPHTAKSQYGIKF